MTTKLGGFDYGWLAREMRRSKVTDEDRVWWLVHLIVTQKVDVIEAYEELVRILRKDKND